MRAKNNPFSNIILSQFVVLTTLDRRKTATCIHCASPPALLSQNYWCHLTSTLYKPDTSLRQTVGVGPDGVRLRESSLYSTKHLREGCFIVVS